MNKLEAYILNLIGKKEEGERSLWEEQIGFFRKYKDVSRRINR